MRILMSSIVITMVTLGCSGKNNSDSESIKEISITELADEVILTDKVWDLIQEPSPSVSDSKGKVITDDQKASFASVNVTLVEKNPEILSDSSLRFKFPQGGGKLDLSRYITDKKGTFYLKFEFPHEDFQPQKVIFFSRIVPRIIAKEKWGQNCFTALDISEKFLENNEGKGIELNTSDERYLNVVGGTFIFSAKRDNKFYVSQVTFVNSKYKSLDCEITR